MIYQKTESGRIAFKNRSVEMSNRQRSAFLLFDGKRTLLEVLKSSSGLGITALDVDDLVSKGLLEQATGNVAVPAVPEEILSAPAVTEPLTLSELTPRQRYDQAYPLATRITAQLGLRGFRLNLAVESAAGYDDLVSLLPQIINAVGEKNALDLKRALGF